MRTTLAIDDHLLDAAKRRARERGKTLGQVVEDALRLELSRPEPEPMGEPPIPISRRSGGLQPGVDLSSNRSMWEALDAGLPIEKLR